MINIKVEAGSNPVFVNGDFSGNFYANGAGNTGKDGERAGKQAKTTPKGEDNGYKHTAESSNKDIAAIPEETLLSLALRKIAGMCKNSRKYKWGLVFQALVRRGLVDRGLSKTDFGKIVNSFTGVSASTVRMDKHYLDKSAKSQNVIKEICAVIDNVTSPLE